MQLKSEFCAAGSHQAQGNQGVHYTLTAVALAYSSWCITDTHQGAPDTHSEALAGESKGKMGELNLTKGCVRRN